LAETRTFQIRPVPPYDFDLTAGYITYFSGRYATDTYENGEYRRLLDLGGKLMLARVRSAGTLDAPVLNVSLSAESIDDGDENAARRQIDALLGANDDLSPFYGMAAQDPHLAAVADGMRGLHMPRLGSVYESLVLAILGQQISIHVARMLRRLLIETCGRSVEIEGERYYLFPTPQAVVEAGLEGLRAIKFSARKAEYVLGISSGVLDGSLRLEELHEKASDDIVKTLVSIRGVGEWTAHWLLIRGVNHPDGFPHGDLALQRIMGRLVNGGEPMAAQDALEYSKRWSPLRSYVTTYLFAAMRSGRLDAILGEA